MPRSKFTPKYIHCSVLSNSETARINSTTNRRTTSRSASDGLCLPPAPGGAHLPVLSDSIPHAHLARVARGHQLVPDEEERIHGDAQAEHSWRDRENKGVGRSPSSQLTSTQSANVLKGTEFNPVSLLQLMG